jgi:outer membrane protein OmpA-like peptidoglycan-associated protein
MRALLLSAAVLAAAACAHATSAPLDSAKANLEAARRGPAAAQDLAVAGRTLARATAELDQRGDSGRVRDLAYVANRQIDIANAKARTAQLQQRLTALTTEKAALAVAPVPPPPPPLPQQPEVAQSVTVEPEPPKAVVIEGTPVKAPQPEPARSPREVLAVFAKTSEEPRGTVLTIPVALLFEPGVDGIGSNGQPRLGEVAELLQQSAGKVTVEVHTDNTGSSTDNQKLAAQRATAIRELLVSLGVKADRIEARGVGDKKPIAENDTAEHRATNRRVEIVIARDGTPVSLR